MSENKQGNIEPIKTENLNKDAVIKLLMSDLKTLRENYDKLLKKNAELEEKLKSKQL